MILQLIFKGYKNLPETGWFIKKISLIGSPYTIDHTRSMVLVSASGEVLRKLTIIVEGKGVLASHMVRVGARKVGEVPHTFKQPYFTRTHLISWVQYTAWRVHPHDSNTSHQAPPLTSGIIFQHDIWRDKYPNRIKVVWIFSWGL